MKKLITLAAFAVLSLGQVCMAQTDIQFFYDFGKDRNYVTTTVEGFYPDKAGDTFFFVDLYFSNAKNNYGACNGSYFEIERSLNFWQNSSLKDFSVLVEYDGATWGQSVFNFGPKYTFHSADWSKYISVAVCYDMMFGQSATTPIKVTGSWAINSLFGVKALTFKGFYDFWGLDSYYLNGQSSNWTFLSEPQLWYKFAEHFDVGAEIELSYNFAGHQGFMCNPCAGLRWTF